MRLGTAAALVAGEIVRGDVAIEDGAITGVGLSPAGRSGLAVPGFVDLQVNGFAGVDFLAADAEAYGQAGQALAATGVTAYQPTLISSPLDVYWPALEAAQEARGKQEGARILGVHLEGPFLNPTWAGAHDTAHLRNPDLGLADRLCDAGPVSYMTLAAELPGGVDLVSHLVRRGVVVSLGHSDADADAAHAAYNCGATAITHLHNAQRRWSSRDPGLSGVALTRPDVVVQAIVDLVHLAPESAYAAFLAARGRFALVTDTIEAAGLAPGRYRLGDRQVTVNERDVRLDDGTLAGSILTMDQAVRNLVDLGASVADAIDAATRVPARLVGRPELGTLRPGTPADVVVLDDHLDVVRTIVAAAEAFAR